MTSAVDRLAAALADRYRIERELGAGGMATVYLAEDLNEAAANIAAMAGRLRSKPPSSAHHRP